jgi:transposase
MEVLYACCCGIDVHAKMLGACLFKGGKKEVRTFATMTEDLLRLLDWLTHVECTHVAIESTGVYWRPVFNILEGAMEVILTNARDAKGYKARKTDVIDAEWLADLLRHGLLKPSFIPPLPIRELRDLTRYWESAGKRLSGTPRKGSAWLRRSLCQAAWAAHTPRTAFLPRGFAASPPARARSARLWLWPIRS